MDDRPDNLGLDDQLCFALYAATNAVVRAYRPLLTRIGLTYPQYLVMLLLWRDDDLSVNAIAERLALPAHGVTPILARLDDQGLVERNRDPDDARVVRVRVTRAGADLEFAASAVQADVVCQTGLSSAELASLRAELHSLTRRMSDQSSLVGGER